MTELIFKQTRPNWARSNTADRPLVIATATVFALPILIWFVLYRFAGYNSTTLTLAQLAMLATGLALLAYLKLDWRRLGLGGRELLGALLVAASAYGAILLAVIFVHRFFGAELPVFRSAYSLHALLDNWFLTAFAEQVLFAGVLFTLVRQRLSWRRGWLAVLIVALLFALWHLLGYLVIGHSGGALFGRLALDVASWGFFGTIYLLSGNLWLTVLAHAATDYPLLPVVTTAPPLGLLFMLLLVAGVIWHVRRSPGGGNVGSRSSSVPDS